MSTPIPGRLGRLHERILTSASNSSPRYTPSKIIDDATFASVPQHLATFTINKSETMN